MTASELSDKLQDIAFCCLENYSPFGINPNKIVCYIGDSSYIFYTTEKGVIYIPIKHEPDSEVEQKLKENGFMKLDTAMAVIENSVNIIENREE